MANRHKRATSAPHLEHEIERCRELEYWSKVEDLAKKLKTRDDPNSAQFTTLGNFLTGEAKLEQYLHDHPPLRSKGTAEAKAGLREAKTCLLSTIGDEAKQLGVHLDSFILLGKLHFAEAAYKEAMDFYERANIDNLEERQLPPRSLKIMAEAFAIKAMCLEKLPISSTSKNKANDKENTIIRCYEVSGDLTLLYLQVADRSETIGQSTWSVASAGTTATGGSASPVPFDPCDTIKTPKERMGSILEAALYQSAKLNLKSGKNAKAISRCRSMLMAEESDSTREIRRNVCCHLAEALLHSSTDGKYTKPDPIEPNSTAIGRRGGSARFTATASTTGESPWRPKRANVSGVFVPKNRYEEVVLALILSEHIASKDAVLSQEPKFALERKRTYEATTVTYDLLTLALARFANFKLLGHVLERSMKFSFRQSHTWEQFALTLACEGKLYRSLQVFQELASQLEDKEIDVGMFLSMARICYERLGLHSEGLELSKRALQSQSAHYSKHSKYYSARCNVFVGLGYTLVARNEVNQSERQQLLSKAEHHYKAALKLDSFDYIGEFYLAMHYAETRRPTEAMEAANRALFLNSEHLSTLQLTILLLSGKKQFNEALDLTDSVLVEYPDSLGLLTLKVRLSEVVYGSEIALIGAKEMLYVAVERMQADEQLEGTNGGPSASTPTIGGHERGFAGLGGSNTEPTLGYGTIHSGMRMFDTMSDKDSVSLHAHSMTASHIERTMSEVASSLSSQFPPRPGGSLDPTYSLMRIWLLCAELHLRQDNIVDAELCTQEAKMLMPMSYHLMYVRGLIHEVKHEFEDARQCYENSLAINPSHVSSLHHLAKVYYQLGYNRLAEQTLKIAVRIDPASEDLWSLLGQVTEALASDFLCQGNQPLESSLSRHGSQSDNEASEEDDYEDYSGPNETASIDLRNLKVESEATPTEETVAGFNSEAAKLFEMAAEFHSIALSVHSSSPIVPFSSIPLAFE